MTAQIALLTQGDADPAPTMSPRNERPLPELEAYVDAAMSSLRIAVVFGDEGAPPRGAGEAPGARTAPAFEAAANDIAGALRGLGFRHVQTMPEDAGLGDTLRRERIGFAWISSGGLHGHNPTGYAPALLDLLGLSYVGHGSLNASTLDNKHLFKRSLMALGIATAPFITWHMARGPFRPKINSRFIRSFKNHWGAFVVKPVCGRASRHVLVVDDERDLPDAVAEVFRATGNHVLIEAYLPGPEYCVTLSTPYACRKRRLYGRSDPFVFSAVQRPHDDGERIAPSLDVRPAAAFGIRCLETEDATRLPLHELGRSVCLDFNLEGPARLDVRADAGGTLSVIEANPHPDLRRPGAEATSLVCGGLKPEDMDYDDLILTLIAGRLGYLQQHRPAALPQLHGA